MDAIRASELIEQLVELRDRYSDPRVCVSTVFGDCGVTCAAWQSGSAYSDVSQCVVLSVSDGLY